MCKSQSELCAILRVERIGNKAYTTAQHSTKQNCEHIYINSAQHSSIQAVNELSKVLRIYQTSSYIYRILFFLQSWTKFWNKQTESCDEFVIVDVNRNSKAKEKKAKQFRMCDKNDYWFKKKIQSIY